METRVFRQSSCAVLAGVVVLMVGAFPFGIGAYHLATGIPLWQQNSKLHGGEHIAGQNELLFDSIGGLLLFALGVVLTLVTVNCTIKIDDSGISATNLFRYKIFRASWDDVTEVEKLEPKRSSGFRVVANGNSLKIQSSTNDMKDLVAEIQRRSPNLKKGN